LEVNLITVILHGWLADSFIDKIELVAKHPSDIVKGLVANFPNFKQLVSPHMFHFYEEREDNSIDLSDKLQDICGLQGTIHLLPVIEGAGGFFKAILGAAMIGLSFAIPGATWLLGIGASLFIGGISEMLAPTVKTPKKYERQDSHLFNDAPTTGIQSDPIPLLYGTFLLKNIPYISSDVSKAVIV
jgi:predicted phage tail protein